MEKMILYFGIYMLWMLGMYGYNTILTYRVFSVKISRAVKLKDKVLLVGKGGILFNWLIGLCFGYIAYLVSGTSDLNVLVSIWYYTFFGIVTATASGEMDKIVREYLKNVGTDIFGEKPLKENMVYIANKDYKDYKKRENSYVRWLILIMSALVIYTILLIVEGLGVTNIQNNLLTSVPMYLLFLLDFGKVLIYYVLYKLNLIVCINIKINRESLNMEGGKLDGKI